MANFYSFCECTQERGFYFVYFYGLQFYKKYGIITVFQGERNKKGVMKNDETIHERRSF